LKSYWGLIVLGFSYFCIIILPYLIFGFGFIYGIISYPDLIDLLLYPPIIGLLFYLTWRNLEVKSEFLNYLFILLFAIHFVGHGLHWAANALNETMKYYGNVAESIHSYAYFLDEFLSHKIMYYTAIGMLLLILYVSKDLSSKLLIKEKLIAELSSLIYGFSITISFIEGQSPYEAILFGVIILLAPILYTRKIKEIYEKPFIRYFFHLGFWIILWASLYFVIFHGFPQPSEWMA